MIYAGVDSSAEKYIMPHLSGLRDASRGGLVGDIVLLIDRVKGAGRDRKALGANFDDTRLFRLGQGRWERVGGGQEFPEITLTSTFEANTGDPQTLRKFIRFAKRSFPARRYALILFGHGESRSVCPDVSSPCADSGEWEDPLFVAEISEGLTHEDAVDVLWVDVCSFGGIENAYQYRPGPGRFSAKVMLATPPLSIPAPFARVLECCGLLGKEKDRRPLVNSAETFGLAALRAIEERLKERLRDGQKVHRESWGLYDLNRADAAKKAVDRLAVAIDRTGARAVVEELRGGGLDAATLNYSYRGDPLQWVISAHFDLFDLAGRIADDDRLSEDVRMRAIEVMREVDSMVIDSFAMPGFREFQPGRNGIYIVFPGSLAEIGGEPVWKSFRWFHPFDQRKVKTAFGLYDWCRDGATPGNGQVENWFELLDAWLDVNDDVGGFNEYRR